MPYLCEILAKTGFGGPGDEKSGRKTEAKTVRLGTFLGFLWSKHPEALLGGGFCPRSSFAGSFLVNRRMAESIMAAPNVASVSEDEGSFPPEVGKGHK
jgi:hypothetical protein